MKVLSYPQYCRFRSLQRRVLERARAPGLQDAHLLALGGVRALPNTRLMYCRDTFSHPALESSAEFSWQFRESGPVPPRFTSETRLFQGRYCFRSCRMSLSQSPGATS